MGADMCVEIVTWPTTRHNLKWLAGARVIKNACKKCLKDNGPHGGIEGPYYYLESGVGITEQTLLEDLKYLKAPYVVVPENLL
jgi:hypothetical protein